MMPRCLSCRKWLLLATFSGAIVISGVVVAAKRSSPLPLPATIEEDFYLSGTQIFDIPNTYIIQPSEGCMGCHGPETDVDPFSTWQSSKMAHAGRNPLFLAKMTLANQLVDNAGYFCLRCHVPHSFITGNAMDPWGETLDAFDEDGVSCHFCHAMVDPIYKPGVSPEADQSILAALDDVPEHYGNSMFVIDPDGIRRGPRGTPYAMHETHVAPFQGTGDFCGTCHDVGNPAVSRQPDGTYWFNPLGEPVPDEDLWTQFPLERTYTEWKLSEFAAAGVDMGGRFGGDGHPTGIMHSCQDCHMPRTPGQSSPAGQWYPDLAQHTFAGSSAWGLEMIGLYHKDNDIVDQDAIAQGIANAVDMLQRAVSLEVQQHGSSLHVKVINETGHKLPTGHIEGRRVFVTVRLYDKTDNLIQEYGHYDFDEALLDEATTVVYEMVPGLSEAASKALGLPAGPSMASVVADMIIKDSRIPPRGFDNEAFAAAGAPVVGRTYADGQYWDEPCFAIALGAVRAEVTVNYQMMTRSYVESLRDKNVTNDWGDILYDLWLATDKAPPIVMAFEQLDLEPMKVGDLNGDGVVDVSDLLMLLGAWGPCPGRAECVADLNGDGFVDVSDLLMLLANWG